jgi:hypothetical protein
LLAAGEIVIDVPAKLSARVRALSGAGHKTDCPRRLHRQHLDDLGALRSFAAARAVVKGVRRIKTALVIDPWVG